MSDILTQVFNSDPWSMVSLTGAIVRRPRISTEFSTAIDWTTTPSYTRTFGVDLEQKRVQLLGIVGRREALPNLAPSDRNMVQIGIPRTGQRMEVTVDEVMDRRTTGTMDVTTLEEMRDEKLGDVQNNITITSNWSKARALDGLVVDPLSRKVISNFYTLFGVQPLTMQWDLTAANIAKLDPNELLGMQKRVIEDSIGSSYVEIRGFKLLCGRMFYRMLRQVPAVQRAYAIYAAMVDASQRLGMTDRNMPGGFTLADNVRVIEMGAARYDILDGNGNVTGTNGYLDDWSARLIVDAPGLARTAFGPSNKLAFQGKVLPYYAWPKLKGDGTGVEVEIDSYEVNYFERPDTIVQISATHD